MIDTIMKTIALLLFASGMAASAAPVSPSASSAPKKLPEGWVYIWGDEFNGRTLDRKKWKPELGVVRNHGSAQTYTDRPKNLRVENGCLVIESHHEQFPNINYNAAKDDWISKIKTQNYTSGSVTTKGVKEFLFGRFEFRAKIPKGKGVWPAIWTLHSNKWGWPANGEIDILEHISQEPNRCYSIFRWGADGSNREFKVTRTTNLPNYSDDFHTYVMEWDKDTMRILIDDKEVGQINISQADYPDGAGNPLKTPCYLIMNTALGGEWCEQPAPNAYPTKFLIDYVRFYQKKEHVVEGKKLDPSTGNKK